MTGYTVQLKQGKIKSDINLAELHNTLPILWSHCTNVVFVGQNQENKERTDVLNSDVRQKSENNKSSSQ